MADPRSVCLWPALLATTRRGCRRWSICLELPSPFRSARRYAGLACATPLLSPGAHHHACGAISPQSRQMHVKLGITGGGRMRWLQTTRAREKILPMLAPRLFHLSAANCHRLNEPLPFTPFADIPDGKRATCRLCAQTHPIDGSCQSTNFSRLSGNTTVAVNGCGSDFTLGPGHHSGRGHVSSSGWEGL